MLLPRDAIVNAPLRQTSPTLWCEARGRSSGVERQLPKLNVVGSNPIARSNFFNHLRGHEGLPGGAVGRSVGSFCATFVRSQLIGDAADDPFGVDVTAQNPLHSILLPPHHEGDIVEG